MNEKEKTKTLPWSSKHPQPQLKRKKIAFLNGTWELNGQPITIPFPPQSALSDYKELQTDDLCYKYTFLIPSEFTQERILLHFGAIDQIATIKINNVIVGSHEGGYLSFSFDITDFIMKDSENLLEVIVKDDLSLDYPYGKQSKNPKGMWYTPVSGIWQTVWLENVPDSYITKLTISPALEKLHLKIESNKAITHYRIEISLPDGDVLKHEFSTSQLTIPIPNPINWTPDTPHLYPLKIIADNDSVESYFALRTISINKINGINRVCLNNKPIFLHGVLDQGYFKDGIFLPETESGYEKDILIMKELGYNLLRKHIKIEPEYFYYACDKLGMLVMQDMVNNGSYSYIKDTVLPTIGFKKKKDLNLNKLEKRRKIFKEHTRQTITHLYNHPCIIAYTIFNEGWGQFNSDEMYDYVKELDNTRLVDSTSGWYAQSKNDFDSEHIYFRLKKLHVKTRPLLISECGGYQLLIKEHFFGSKEYGYGACKNKDELTKRILEMYEKMILPSIKDGVCGCIYTQLSDVEGEINGLYTYDRAVCKVNKKDLQNLSLKLINAVSSDTL